LPPGGAGDRGPVRRRGEGLAGDADLLHELDRPLSDELGKRLAEPAAEELSVSHHLRVALVGELEAQLGPGENGDAHRRLAEDGSHPLGLPLLDDPELRTDELGIHPGQQLTRAEGLDQVVVGAGLQPLAPRLLAGPGREHDHRQSAQRCIAADGGQELEAVHLRHHHVGQQEVGPGAADRGQRLRAVAHQLHLVAGLEHPTQVLAHVGVVVRDHDSSLARTGRGHRLPGTLCRGEPAKGFLHVGLGGTERRSVGLVAHPLRRQMGTAAGDPNLEGAALPRAALDRDPSSVQPHDVAHQGKADPRALVGPGARALHAVEALEEVRQLVGGNAGAGVPDPEEDRVSVQSEAHLDRARQGELERVGQEVEHHPFPHVTVDVDRLRQRRRVDLEPQPGAVERGAEARGEVRGEPGEVGGAEGGIGPARLQPGELEQRVDQPLQAERVPVNQVDALAGRRHPADQ
jgi:hypothetical protein